MATPLLVLVVSMRPEELREKKLDHFKCPG
jgi:hypothetical protein